MPDNSAGGVYKGFLFSRRIVRLASRLGLVLIAGALFVIAAYRLTQLLLVPEVTVAIAKTGDDYGALFTNLARVSDSKTVRIETLPLPDSAAVASALEQRQVDFAVIRPDETLPANAMTAAILREEPVILLTFAASKIEHPDQLAKKRIGAVKLSAADRAALGKILAFHDASDAQIIDIGASADEIKSAVTGKRIDAVAFIDQPDGVWRLVRGGERSQALGHSSQRVRARRPPAGLRRQHNCRAIAFRQSTRRGCADRIDLLSPGRAQGR